jgi:hypothetical protein
LLNASSETDVLEKEKEERKDDDENVMSLDNAASASEGIIDPIPQKDGQPSVIPDSFNELWSQWINGYRRSVCLQPALGSLYVSGLRRSMDLNK